MERSDTGRGSFGGSKTTYCNEPECSMYHFFCKIPKGKIPFVAKYLRRNTIFAKYLRKNTFFAKYLRKNTIFGTWNILVHYNIVRSLARSQEVAVAKVFKLLPTK